MLKSLVFYLLRSSSLFAFLLFPPPCSSTNYHPHLPRVDSLVCLLSRPRKREGLESVKTWLVKEQKLRTERRIQDLLHPRQAFEELEVSDDSEEENRVCGWRTSTGRDKATQTDSSSYSCRCGVIVGVFVCVTLLFGLVLFSQNGRQK